MKLARFERGGAVHHGLVEGGSVTVVFDDPAQLADFAGAVTDGHPGWSVHHLTPTGGVRIDVDRP